MVRARMPGNMRGWSGYSGPMKPIRWTTPYLFAFLALTLPCTLGAQAIPDDGAGLDEAIRLRIERNGEAAPILAVVGERLHARSELPRFYEGRGFQPAWVGPAGPGDVVESLVRALSRSALDGLNPHDYHHDRIRALIASARGEDGSDEGLTASQLADLDLLLTDAFLLYAAHLVGGRVDPVAIHPEWSAVRREADLVAALDSALADGDIEAALESLLPRHAEYRRLRATLERYRRIAASGGWPEIPARTLRSGREDDAVPLLRTRLRLSGDLAVPGEDDADGAAAGADDRRFGPDLEAAVRRFQARHGLEQDGIVSLETSAVMNTPVEDRIRQLELSLERWRWLPRELGERHIRVNIAGFDLDVFEGDTVVFSTRVMVGQRFRRTPVFSDRMTYLVLNPTWTIPPGILEQDKLPLIRRDVDYLRQNRIRVFAPSGQEVPASSVDWSAMTGNTGYRLRMEPGPENPLGQVKFMFPNQYSVYLHDTPSRELFDRNRRDFSSGCIRVERPLELATYLLGSDPRWSRERIDAALRNPAEQTVPLPRAVPVHLLYWTAWAETDGTVHFREDVYGRDAALDAAMREPPPAVPSQSAPGAS
jgi:murein L,D-transpeptidase YcbB/YkuD